MFMLWLRIPLRYKLAALVLAAFALGLLRWKNAAVNDAIERIKVQQLEAAEAAARARRKVQDEVDILDDVGLAERAAEWVRNPND